jgi:predicted RNA-binding protein with PUA-like domain
MKYWLMKSEPDVYSIEDLEREQTTLWDGVRNYQARNFLKAMTVGDRAFFYHSNTQPPGIVGMMEIIESLVVDPTQFLTDSDYYDPKSSVANPRWHTVKVKFISKFDRSISLNQLRDRFTPEQLLAVKPGNRLSVLPVSDRVAAELIDSGI